MEYYYIYQITNLLNNKIYIGVHKTKNLDDGYMGSGKRIRSAVRKYGIENFKKDILEFFNSSDEMYIREKEIVNEEFLSRNDIYNLQRGGGGGFDYINRNQLYGFSDIEVAKRGRLLADIILFEKYGENWRNILAIKAAEKSNTPEAKVKAKETKIRNGTFGNISHLISDDIIQKKKETYKKINHQQGSNNSQFNTIWITNGIENKKIDKNIPIPIGWIRGRKVNKK